MSLCARVAKIDGVGENPQGTLAHTTPTRRLAVEVTWVRVEPRGLYLAVRHAGAPLAAEPVVYQGQRPRPSLRERLYRSKPIPQFLPARLPVPRVGQQVTLDCDVAVMADYEIEEMWPGPDVRARYRVDRIDAEILTPVPLPPDTDEFDELPEPACRVAADLSSTRSPLDVTADGPQPWTGPGEVVSAYRLVLSPIT